MKIYTFTVFKKELKELLNATYNFWEVKDVDDDVVNYTKSIFNFIRFIIYSFAVGVISTVLLYAYFGIVGDMPFVVYIPNKFFMNYEVIRYTQMIYLIGGISIVLGFDGTFMYLCYKCITQIQIIKYKIENLMSYEDKHFVFDMCIQHHGFMLR